MKSLFFNIRFTAAIILFLGTITSCKKTFLASTSPATISDNTAIVDSASAYTALNGVYDGLQSSDYYGGDGFAAAAFLSGGDGLWVGTLNFYNNFTTHTYSADNTLLYEIWAAIYKVVNRANNIIAKVPQLTDQQLSQKTKNQYIGQAYFIRSLCFFDLVRLWGNIPLIEIPVADVSAVTGIRQSSKDAVFNQVEKDLLTALSLLPTGVDRNRITQNTANAFLSRLYLYLKQWDKAEAYASKIIDDSKNYALVSWSSFISDKNTHESIFELEFTTADKSAHYGSWSSVNYRNQYCPNTALYNLLHNDTIGGARSQLVTDQSTPAVKNYYVQNLYWRTAGDNPTYVFRLGEQYLIRAEARVRKASPDLSGALSDLNAIRKRALVPALSLPESGVSLLVAILKEKRVEFALEPQRWFDLVRTGNGAEVGVTDANKTIFPIPFNDLEADKDLVQNAGY